jgi:hypothetical protein
MKDRQMKPSPVTGPFKQRSTVGTVMLPIFPDADVSFKKVRRFHQRCCSLVR